MIKERKKVRKTERKRERQTSRKNSSCEAPETHSVSYKSLKWRSEPKYILQHVLWIVALTSPREIQSVSLTSKGAASVDWDYCGGLWGDYLLPTHHQSIAIYPRPTDL